MKKILIVGFGGMGKAHLNSLKFIEKKLEILIFDRFLNMRELIKNTEDFKSKSKHKIIIKKFIPKKEKFFLLIEATFSNTRYSNLKYILKNNKVENILLEKMIFSKESSFRHFERNFQNNIINTYVNVWSKSLFKMLDLDKKKLKNVSISVTLPKGDLITNMIHFIYLFMLMTKNKSLSFNTKKLDKKYFSSKRSGFHEISGKIEISNSRGNIILKTRKKINSHIITIQTEKEKLRINITRDGNIHIINYQKNTYTNNKFPYSSIITKKLVNDLLVRKKSNILPKYDNLNLVSIQILDQIKETYGKKILFT